MTCKACYPITIPVRSAVPTFEPVTRAEAKSRILSAGVTQHDAEIDRLIKEAREQVERDAGIVFCTGAYVIKRTGWNDGWSQRAGWSGDQEWFELPSSIRPITSITSIVYTASDGTSTTWAASSYSLETFGIAPFVKLAYGSTWPSLRGDLSGISITVVAGYATVEAIPARARSAVILWLRHELLNEPISAAYDRLIEGLRREVYA